MGLFLKFLYFYQEHVVVPAELLCVQTLLLMRHEARWIFMTWASKTDVIFSFSETGLGSAGDPDRIKTNWSSPEPESEPGCAPKPPMLLFSESILFIFQLVLMSHFSRRFAENTVLIVIKKNQVFKWMFLIKVILAISCLLLNENNFVTFVCVCALNEGNMAAMKMSS